MKRYFVVPSLGAGTADDPYRPDLPGDIERWVGLRGPGGNYLIVAARDITEGGGRSRVLLVALAAIAAARGLRLEDIRDRWDVAA